MLHSYREKRYVEALGLISFTCLFLFVCRVLVTGTPRYWFIPENLFLSWISLAAAWLLIGNLKKRPWRDWQNIGLSAVWLIFLPNSWYVLTDYIHVYPTGEVSEVFDIGLISLLVLTGCTLGFTSLYMVHKEFLKRFSQPFSYGLVAVILFLASFAIYLGRYLRWNTWDVVTDPGGIILNVSDRILNPFEHPGAFNTTILFFFILGIIYTAILRLLPIATASNRDKP